MTALTEADTNRYVALAEEGGENLAISAVLGYLFVASAHSMPKQSAAHGIL